MILRAHAIVLAKADRGERTVGVGAGQMSRVISVQIACEKAGEESKGSVLASDAFFPFPDGLELAGKHGITAVAQPGGSVKDAEAVLAGAGPDLAAVLFQTGLPAVRVATRPQVAATEADDVLPSANTLAASTGRLVELIRRCANPR